VKKHPRRKPITPKSQIRSALRQLWLRSRERAQAVKDAGRACERCHAKASTARGREVSLEVHHRDGIDWDGLADLIRQRLLPPADRLEVLCHRCHEEEHQK
jgi:predicted HNH restriction endonuclease